MGQLSLDVAPPKLFHYLLYGYILKSEVPLLDLPLATGSRGFRDSTHFSFKDNVFPIPARGWIKSGGLSYWADRQCDQIFICGLPVGDFCIELKKRRITWKRSSDNAIGPARFFIKGQIFGFVLSHLHPGYIWHGNVLSIQGKGVVLSGPMGSGKSTLTASFLSQGFKLLSDDMAVVKPTTDKSVYRLMPGVPEIRLWPRTKTHLRVPNMKPVPIMHAARKERFVLNQQTLFKFQKKSNHLNVLYFISRHLGQKIQIKKLEKREALFSILGNLYTRKILSSKVKAAQFKNLSQIVQYTPVFQFKYPSGFRHLPSVRRAMLNHLNDLRPHQN